MSSTAEKPCSFLEKLPRELRDMVYSHLRKPTPMPVFEYRPKYRPDLLPIPAVLLLCRQIHVEYMDCYLENISVSVTVRYPMCQLKTCSNIPEMVWQNAKRVTIRWGNMREDLAGWYRSPRSPNTDWERDAIIDTLWELADIVPAEADVAFILALGDRENIELHLREGWLNTEYIRSFSHDMDAPFARRIHMRLIMMENLFLSTVPETWEGLDAPCESKRRILKGVVTLPSGLRFFRSKARCLWELVPAEEGGTTASFLPGFDVLGFVEMV